MQKWGDLLRVSTKLIVSPVFTFKFNRWLEASVASNQPYDQFAEQILLATEVRQHPQGNFFRSAADTNDATETAAQVFLGTRFNVLNATIILLRGGLRGIITA